MVILDNEATIDAGERAMVKNRKRVGTENEGTEFLACGVHVPVSTLQ